MTDPAIRMLFERLLWPVPRVRWEVGRTLACLIREGEQEVASGLLNWIGARRLESEVILGIGIVDAFDLGEHFRFGDVSEAVQAPSLVSDCLLKKNFRHATHLSPFRYAISPSEPADLSQHEEAWFDRYRKWAVPPIFSSVLARLQRSTGFPFLMRWEHDWRWLQATEPRPAVEYPHFFSGKDRNRLGQFDHGQRELYVSAYLRTLAYAVICGPMPHDVAERYSLLALTMNRGLADVEPVDRPGWARNLFPCEAEHMKELAEKLWAYAERDVQSEEVPLALRVVDIDTRGFVEFDVKLVMGPAGFTAGPAEAETLDWIFVNERHGEMAGLVGRDAGVDSIPIGSPVVMVQGLVPENVGRAHTEMARNIRLASPYVFRTSADVQCSPTDIRLDAGGDVLSRWVHWYADWQPANLPEIESAICSMTTVSKSRLDELRSSSGLEIARLIRIRRGTRSAVHREHEVDVEAYWV